MLTARDRQPLLAHPRSSLVRRARVLPPFVWLLVLGEQERGHKMKTRTFTGLQAVGAWTLTETVRDADEGRRGTWRKAVYILRDKEDEDVRGDAHRRFPPKVRVATGRRRVTVKGKRQQERRLPRGHRTGCCPAISSTPVSRCCAASTGSVRRGPRSIRSSCARANALASPASRSTRTPSASCGTR